MNWLGGPSGSELAKLVLAGGAVFRALEPLVEAVCSQPWRIRHPRDLAAAVEVPLTWLRRICCDAGFNRVEHFIVCVRVVAYEQLVVTGRMARSAARRRVGFDDPSNMRRHFSRALQRSPGIAVAIEGGPTA